MHLRNQLIFFLVCLTDGAIARPTIEHRPVPAHIVSEAELPVSASVLRAALLTGLRGSEERNDPMYKNAGFVSRDAAGRETLLPAHAETIENASFGKIYFRDPSHAKDLYVHFMGQPIVSSYYYANGEALDYNVTFSISIAAISGATSKISIRTVKSEIFNGKVLNLHAMGFVPEAEPVPGSPLDQYKMLVYAAHLVGVKLTTNDSEAN